MIRIRVSNDNPYIADVIHEIGDAESLMDSLIQHHEEELLRAYKDMLDDVYGDVKIGEYSYSASHAIECVDDVVFRCGFSDYLDNVSYDVVATLERGEPFYIECMTISEEREEEEEDE